MRRDDPNREYLLAVASTLGDLCNEVVFVGGSVAGLLITDPVAEGIRATKDVDAIIEATTQGQYYQVEMRLPALGMWRTNIAHLPEAAFRHMLWHMSDRHVKLFKNGRNQAVRIPREFELPGDDAIMRKDGNKLIIEAVPPRSLIALLATLEPLSEAFPPIPDETPDEVDI
jgi:antitoxin VapB